MSEGGTVDGALKRVGQFLAVGGVACGIVWDVADGKFTQNLHDERLRALEKLTAVDQIVEYQVQRAQTEWEIGLLRGRVKELEAEILRIKAR